MTNETVHLYARLFRANQWIKNLVIFTAIIFSGKMFDLGLLAITFYGFIVFCGLSSASYILNDIIDYPHDIRHPFKKNRPIAAGTVTVAQATFLVFILTLTFLIIALFFSIQFFLLCLAFILLHFFYSLYLKKQPVIDIFVISLSFMLRTFAGEVVSGFHIPIWLLFTIFFISLFMASIKRHAELIAVGSGKGTRESLYHYRPHFLDFLTYTFATATIIAYATYSYSADANTSTVQSLFHFLPGGRKWMMLTVPLVVYGIARYAQLLYEKEEGERPEKVITTDTPLVVTIFLWGIIVIGLIYLF